MKCTLSSWRFPVHFVGLTLLCVYSIPAHAFTPAIADSLEEAEEDSLVYQIEQTTTIGTRYTERIIDIPYSVFSVDKKELSFGRKVSAKDVLADVPGMFLQSRYGNHDLRISLRGFGTRSNSGARAIRILADGIPESDPDGETALDAIDFTSLGGVDVAKGNLSSLYANAPGGVINFMSDLYFLRDHVSLSTQVGQFGMWQQGLKVGLQNPGNRLLLTYNYSNLDGYREHSQEYQHLVNLAFEAYPGERTSIGVFGNYVRGVSKQPGPLTEEEFVADPFQASAIALSQNFRRLTRKGKLGIRYTTRFGEADLNEFEVTIYGAMKSLERADVETYSFAERRTVGAWARLTHRGQLFGHGNTLTVGTDFASQSGPVVDFENTNGVRGISVQNEITENLNNIGVYFLNRFSITDDELDLVLSARFDHNLFDRGVFIPFGFIDTSRTFSKFAPKVGLTYKLTRGIALYTSYGKSYDIPALSEMGNTPISSHPVYSINPDLDPQQSTNVEIGIKGNRVEPDAEFLPRVFFDITFFHLMIEDEIVPFVINQHTYYRNAGRTTRTGIEIGVKSHPVRHLEVALNYTFARYRYTDYVTTIFTPSGSSVVDFSGNTMPSIPAGILNFIVMLEQEVTDDVEGIVLWDCDYISRLYVNDANTGTSPSYFYGNVLAGLNIALGDVSAVVYAGVHNIFDRRYAGFINTNDFQDRYFETGEPRNTYGGIRLSFRP